jgi:hypothetical protein
MADALTVLPLDYVKKEVLSVDLSDTWRDNDITRCIKTSVAWVERYTDYALYERDVTINAVGCKTEIATYPIVITGVVNEDDAPVVDYKTRTQPLSITLYVPDQSVISATIGYDDVTDIPQPLISAAEKLIVYLFEQKDSYSVSLPIDIQILINEYRRSPTF